MLTKTINSKLCIWNTRAFGLLPTEILSLLVFDIKNKTLTILPLNLVVIQKKKSKES